MRLKIALHALEARQVSPYALSSMRRYKIAQKVGKKIRLARERKRLTQEDTAERAGIHVSTLGRIERGESNPPIHTVSKIAKALKMPLKELFS